MIFAYPEGIPVANKKHMQEASIRFLHVHHLYLWIIKGYSSGNSLRWMKLVYTSPLRKKAFSRIFR